MTKSGIEKLASLPPHAKSQTVQGVSVTKTDVWTKGMLPAYAQNPFKPLTFKDISEDMLTGKNAHLFEHLSMNGINKLNEVAKRMVYEGELVEIRIRGKIHTFLPYNGNNTQCVGYLHHLFVKATNENKGETIEKILQSAYLSDMDAINLLRREMKIAGSWDCHEFLFNDKAKFKLVEAGEDYKVFPVRAKRFTQKKGASKWAIIKALTQLGGQASATQIKDQMRKNGFPIDNFKDFQIGNYNRIMSEIEIVGNDSYDGIYRLTAKSEPVKSEEVKSDGLLKGLKSVTEIKEQDERMDLKRREIERLEKREEAIKLQKAKDAEEAELDRRLAELRK